MPAPIEFVCVFPAHAPRLLRVGGYITVVRGGWAYCSAAVEPGHVWRQIAPTSLTALVAPGAAAATFVSEELVEDETPVLITTTPALVAQRAQVTKRAPRRASAKPTNGELSA